MDFCGYKADPPEAGNHNHDLGGMLGTKRSAGDLFGLQMENGCGPVSCTPAAQRSARRANQRGQKGSGVESARFDETVPLAGGRPDDLGDSTEAGDLGHAAKSAAAGTRARGIFRAAGAGGAQRLLGNCTGSSGPTNHSERSALAKLGARALHSVCSSELRFVWGEFFIMG